MPVNIDTARPAGSSGLMEATLALRYNPQLFSVTAADIKLGTVPSAGSGWQLGVAINPETGEIGITLFSTTPIQSTAGGSLVTITLHSDRARQEWASRRLSLVDEVDPTGLRVYQTGLADSQGALVMHESVGRVQLAAGKEPDMVNGPEATVKASPPAHSPLPTARYLEQVYAEIGGMAAEQSASLPEPEEVFIPAEDWSIVQGVLGFAAGAFSAPEVESLDACIQGPTRQTGPIWASDDPDIDV